MTARTTRRLLLAAVLLAGCSRGPAPSTVPAPRTAPNVPAAEPQSGTPNTGTPNTGMPQPAKQAPAAQASAAPEKAAGINAPNDSSARADTISVSRSEVTTTAVKVLGDSVPVDSASAAVPEGEHPTWDIDVRSYETQARVEHYVQLFSGEAHTRIAARLEQGSRYDAMLRAKFAKAGLPEDLTYLALIESGYDPHAYSRAAAVGMWQFMASTARGAGLRVDWWVDERRDPARSTDAATKFIRWLKDEFGSLYLAVAAYNGGNGRISRGLTRYADDLEGTTGEDVFFALAQKDYLPAETKDYVPQLIAAALVGKEPVRYGLTIRPLPPYAYDSAEVGPGVPLAAVATAAGSTVAELHDLNPAILRGMTPPTGSYWVHVPVGHAATVPAALAALDPAARRALKKIESKKGETLGSIASRSGLSAKQLAWYNPKVETLKSGRLRPGQTIAIPAPEVAAAAFDVPDPSIERYGSSSRRTVHVVRRGETLGGIARKYHTTVAHLKAINGLRKTSVFPGQAIVVKGSAKKSSKSGRVSRSRSGAHHASATTKSSPRSKSSPAHAAKKKATKKKAKTRS